MTPELLLRTTVVFTTALLLVLVLPRRLPQLSHLVCTMTVGVALLLPLVHWRLALPGAFTLRFDANGVVGLPTSGLARVPWNAIWLCGAAALLLRFAIGVAYLAWKTRNAAGVGNVRFAAVRAPLAWGWFRPVILMPRAAVHWTEDRWRLALAHELGHVRRGDIWTSTLATAATAMYWFHPLVWWLAHRMREAQELACDEAVLEAGNDRIAYAELLLAMAGVLEAGSFECRMTGGKMKVRLERILHWKRAGRSSRKALWLAAAACGGFLLLGSLVTPVAAEVERVGNGVTAPEVIEKHEPAYTDEAKKAKISGPVVLSIVVTGEGAVTDVEVVKSLDPGLDRNAIEAISSWRFKPALKDGKPVAVQTNVEFGFKLK